MMLDLDEPFRTIWKNRDAFVEVEALSGELFREVKSRRTFRFEINGCGFFLKHHLGVGWAEILKNLDTVDLNIGPILFDDLPAGEEDMEE